MYTIYNLHQLRFVPLLLSGVVIAAAAPETLAGDPIDTAFARAFTLFVSLSLLF